MNGVWYEKSEGFLRMIWGNCMGEEEALDLGGISRDKEKASQVRGTARTWWGMGEGRTHAQGKSKGSNLPRTYAASSILEEDEAWKVDGISIPNPRLGCGPDCVGEGASGEFKLRGQCEHHGARRQWGWEWNWDGKDWRWLAWGSSHRKQQNLCWN